MASASAAPRPGGRYRVEVCERCRIRKDNVSLCCGDQLLCVECEEMNDQNLKSDGAAPSVITMLPNKTMIKCELLCFLQEKSAVMAADHIVKLCADFYSKDEIAEARSLLDPHVPKRLPRHQGSNFSRLTVQDLLKACIDPNVALPEFIAKSIDRLPPVDVTHCDVSAILKELQALRSEVRQSSELHAEHENTTASELQLLRAEVMELQHLRDELAQLHSEAVEVRQLQEEIAVLKDTVLSLNDTVIKLQSKPVALNLSTPPVNPSTGVLDTVSGASELPATLPSYCSITTRNLQPTSGNQSVPASHRRKVAPRPAAICGKARGMSSLAVEGVRRADIFISRLRPDTTVANASALIKECFPLCVSVKSVKLDTRFDTYASFHAELCVQRSQFDDLISCLYKEDSWPSGILVRRFFRTKNGAQN